MDIPHAESQGHIRKGRQLQSLALLLLARLNSFTRRPEKAAGQVARSLECNPEQSPTRYRRAALYHRRIHQNASATRYDQQAMEITSVKWRDLWNQAQAGADLKRSQDALALYQRYAMRGGDAYRAYSAMANFYRDRSEPHTAGRWRLVIDSRQAALAANSGNPADWSRLGEAYLAVDEPENARHALEEADKRLPGERRLALAKYLAPRLHKVKRRAGNRKYLARAVDALTGRTIAHCRGPRAVKTWYDLGRCHERLGDRERSAQFYKKALTHTYNKRLQDLGIGGLHEEEKRWHDSIRAYRESLKQWPSRQYITLRLGHVHCRLGQFKQAANCYERALRAGANPFECHFYCGLAHEFAGHFSKAVEEYHAAASSKNKHAPTLYYRLGLVLKHCKDYEAACTAFIQINCDDSVGNFIKDITQSRKMREQETKITTEDCSSSHYWWARAYEHQIRGDWHSAARCFQAGIDREPRHTRNGLYLMAYALFKSGNCEAAANAFAGLLIDRDDADDPRAPIFGQKPPSVAVSYVHHQRNKPVRRNTVIYESYEAVTIRGNPRAIFEQRRRFDPHDEWLHVWIVNDPASIPAEWKSQPNVVFVPRDCQRYAVFYAVAEYIVCNSSMRSYITRRPQQRVLNTWHGTPLKTIGSDDNTRFNNFGGVQRAFLQTTHMISPNRHTTDILLDKWDMRNIYTGNLAETGYPRIDLTLNADPKLREKLRKRLGLNNYTPVVLFAPTWRGSLGALDFDGDRLLRDLRAMRKTDAQLLFRGHYFHEAKLESGATGCTVVPDDIDTNELLSIVDIMVTDYSSVCVDFLPRQKPVIYYAYDQSEYAAERGLYVRPDEMPGVVCSDREGLVSTLQQVMSAHGKGMSHDLERFNCRDDGNATARVIDFFFHGDYSHIVHSGNDNRDKTNAFIYAGSFNKNGMTAALRTLTNDLDRSRVNPIIAFTASGVANNPERRSAFAQFDQAVDFFPRFGHQVLTKREGEYIEDAERQHFQYLSPEQNRVIAGAYEREFQRVVGCARLSALIDYTGYDQFWSRLIAYSGWRARKIMYLHNDMHGEQRAKFWNLLSTFALYHRYDALVSVSRASRDANRDQLTRLHDIGTDRFIYADNVFDAAEVQKRAREPLDDADAELLSSSGPVFMTIGRLSVEKDHAKLIRAFAAVAREHAEAKLVIVGHGALHGDLERLIQALGMGAHVHLLGLRENPLPLLASADSFVLSSNHEGKPIVLFEAMALNVPVIATDIPGLRSVLADGGGSIVPNTEEALRDAMDNFVAGALTCAPAPDLRPSRDRALRMFYHDVLALPAEAGAEESLATGRELSSDDVESSAC